MPVASLTLHYIGQTSVNVIWEAPLGSDVSGYRIWVERTGSTVATETVVSGVTQQELTGLQAGQEYMVKIVTISGPEESLVESEVMSETFTTCEFTQIAFGISMIRSHDPFFSLAHFPRFCTQCL